MLGVHEQCGGCKAPFPKVYPAHAAAKASRLQTLKPKMLKSPTCKPPNLELKTFKGVPGKVLLIAVQGDT